MTVVVLPAVASLAALVALTLSLRRVDRELTALRRSLRRTTAAAVAVDELDRSARLVVADVQATADDARRRLQRHGGRGGDR